MSTATQHEPTLRLLSQQSPSGGESIRCWASGKTHKGLVRRANEDQFLVARLHRHFEVVECGFAQAKRVQDSPGLLLVVADGVGSVEGSAVAGASAIDFVADAIFRRVPWMHGATLDQEAFVEGVEAALSHCQSKLRAVAERKQLDPRIATTLTLAYVHWPYLHLAHVGDSRAYLLREGKLKQLTHDHTLAQQLADSGTLRPSEVERSPFAQTLTSCVGGSEPRFRIDAERHELSSDDVLLLCTDGLPREVPDERMTELLACATRGVPIPVCTESLIDDALAGGGHDNVTAIVARFS